MCINMSIFNPTQYPPDNLTIINTSKGLSAVGINSNGGAVELSQDPNGYYYLQVADTTTNPKTSNVTIGSLYNFIPNYFVGTGGLGIGSPNYTYSLLVIPISDAIVVYLLNDKNVGLQQWNISGNLINFGGGGGSISTQCTASYADEFYTMNGSGYMYLSGNTATATTPLQNSSVINFNGNYWYNNAISYTFNCNIQWVLDSVTPSGHLSFSSSNNGTLTTLATLDSTGKLDINNLQINSFASSGIGANLVVADSSGNITTKTGTSVSSGVAQFEYLEVNGTTNSLTFNVTPLNTGNLFFVVKLDGAYVSNLNNLVGGQGILLVNNTTSTTIISSNLSQTYYYSFSQGGIQKSLSINTAYSFTLTLYEYPSFASVQILEF